jgi:hypothetical protein
VPGNSAWQQAELHVDTLSQHYMLKASKEWTGLRGFQIQDASCAAADAVRHRAGKQSNALSWIGLAGPKWSECKHTHRRVLCLDCLQKGVGMFAMLPHGKDEQGRVRKGNWDSDGLLELSVVASTLYTT